MKVIGIAGWSGAGKTTLLTRVIPLLAARGWRVSTIKHAHHQFDVDQPGKDSHTHRQAGATEVLVSSANRFALMHELRGEPELSLGALLEKLAPVDLVLVEGFKREAHPKLEVYRASVGSRCSRLTTRTSSRSRVTVPSRRAFRSCRSTTSRRSRTFWLCGRQHAMP